MFSGLRCAYPVNAGASALIWLILQLAGKGASVELAMFAMDFEHPEGTV